VDIYDITQLARDHADRISSDVELCTTREEHVRLTARANEAENIANALHQHIVSLMAKEQIE